jgi:UDP-N-acetylmuramoylalanine--D-glutamate ligase
MTTVALNLMEMKNYIIVGLGKTGLSCAKFLAQQHVNVGVMDTRDIPPGLEELQQEYPEVLIKTGKLDTNWLHQADTVVLSPGIDPRIPEIQQLKQAGISVIGDVELFSRFANAPVIAITGSNGKSTVTTLLAEMAITSGKQIKVGGNLGTPALELISYPAPDFYILELSSFQLETVENLNPFAAVILNISADHMDRYDSLADYQAAKARIYKGNGVMVLNNDDPYVRNLAVDERNTIRFGINVFSGTEFGVKEHEDTLWIYEKDTPILAVNELKIAGTHNISNALAALALGSAMGLSIEGMINGLKSYSGLAHRCEYVTEINGVTWFNDSKSTNVGACVAAIEGLSSSKDIVLIAGGVGKNQDFSGLTACMDKSVKAVVLIGVDAEDIASVVPENTVCIQADSLKEAVKQAEKLAVSGDKVLLSPACASFDMFTGYEDRGEQFMQIVKAINE